MKEIGKHISELLFDHDCVIVPSFGGFLASNQSSRVLLPNHIILPPYRRIAFNVYLKQNDGLLANHVVKSENISYAEATTQIESFTIKCIETLENGRKVNITEVGNLFYDKEKNIQFEVFRNINHQKNSFGLDSIHFLPINRDEEVEKKKLPVEKKIRSSLPLENKKRAHFSLSSGKKIIGTTLIVAGLVWFSLNLYLVAPQQYESTSLNPFDSQNIALSKTDSIRNLPSEKIALNTLQNNDTLIVGAIPAETLASIEIHNEIDNTKKIDTEVLLGKTEKSKAIINETTQPLQQELNIITAKTNMHYLISGVFKIKENAQSKYLHLQRLGFTNARIIEANNLSYVSYEEFTRLDGALALADSLQRKNIEGWIWKH